MVPKFGVEVKNHDFFISVSKTVFKSRFYPPQSGDFLVLSPEIESSAKIHPRNKFLARYIKKSRKTSRKHFVFFSAEKNTKCDIERNSYFKVSKPEISGGVFIFLRFRAPVLWNHP